MLNQVVSDAEIRFRCQVGHAFTPLGLADAQSDELERALSIAVRTHRDRIRLFEQMAESARSRGLTHSLRRWNVASSEASEMVAVLESAMAALRKPSAEGEA